MYYRRDMRVFISHSSRQRAMAEQLTVALRSEGHTVFFDRDSVEVGEAFHAKIRQEVRRAHAMVFLIDSTSVEEGSLARTELRIAEHEWDSFGQRVVPVMAERTPMSEIPANLREADIIPAGGNLASEVSYSLDRLARARTGARLKSVAVVAVAVLLLALGGTAIAIGMLPGEDEPVQAARQAAAPGSSKTEQRTLSSKVEPPAAVPEIEPPAEEPAERTTERPVEDPAEDPTEGVHSTSGGDSDSAADGESGSVVAGASDPSQSARCKAMRQAARDAFARRLWSEVLRNVASTTCWKGKYRGEYAEMKIKALFETKRWAPCAKLARQAQSASSKKLAKVCLTRVEMGG
ncbi:MAG: toll/interleukin-1 receptor domain-containing protein [Myxococcota bacterium]